MPAELPASALYSSPRLGRLWKRVHQTCSPFLHRSAVRRLYQQPATRWLRQLPCGYSLIALGCAEGHKESLLLEKLPRPAFLLAADTNRFWARHTAHRLPGKKKRCLKINLSEDFPSLRLPPAPVRLFTLFGVLPNLDPLPLLQRVGQAMNRGDLLLFSANLAPGSSGFVGARKVLPQYDNRVTRRWLEAAVKRFRPPLPKGRLDFGVHPDPRQKSLARIEARWLSASKTTIVFSSRRPTAGQVETWIRRAHFRKLARFQEPRREEGLWLVAPSTRRGPGSKQR